MGHSPTTIHHLLSVIQNIDYFPIYTYSRLANPLLTFLIFTLRLFIRHFPPPGARADQPGGAGVQPISNRHEVVQLAAMQQLAGDGRVEHRVDPASEASLDALQQRERSILGPRTRGDRAGWRRIWHAVCPIARALGRELAWEAWAFTSSSCSNGWRPCDGACTERRILADGCSVGAVSILPPGWRRSRYQRDGLLQFVSLTDLR